MFKYGQWVVVDKVPGVITYVHPGPKEPKYVVDIGDGKEMKCSTDELELFNMGYWMNPPEEEKNDRIEG